MANGQNTKIETDYYEFLGRVLVNPDLTTGNSGEFQAVINKLLLLNDVDQLNNIRIATFSMLKRSPPPFSNSFIAVQEIKNAVIELSRSNRAARLSSANKIRTMVNETFVNRVKTSEKQHKAVTDFIKG